MSPSGLCERCLQPTAWGEHGWLKCPMEPRAEWVDSLMSGTDKRYEFTTQHVKPGTEIRSKGQWKRFLKANKMNDDLTMKEHLEFASRGADKRKEENRRHFVKQMTHYFEQKLPQFGSEVKRIPQELARMKQGR